MGFVFHDKLIWLIHKNFKYSISLYTQNPIQFAPQFRVRPQYQDFRNLYNQDATICLSLQQLHLSSTRIWFYFIDINYIDINFDPVWETYN